MTIALTRPHYFLLALLAAFFNPFVIYTSYHGGTSVFLVVIPITLLVWLAIKWDTFVRLTSKSSHVEVVLGSTLLAADYARNAILDSRFGMLDMLVVVVGLIIAFFGLKAVRQHFLLPTVYLAVLVSVYRLEDTLPQMQILQNFLAQVMVAVLNPLGIRATLWQSSRDVVTVWGRPGVPGPNPFSLWIEQGCTGVKGMFAYGALAILMVLDVPAPLRKKLAVTLVGLAGTFFINIGRLLTIFLAAYAWGVDAGLTVHSYLGYGIFIVWILVYWSVALRYVSGPGTAVASVKTPILVPKLPSLHDSNASKT